MRTLLFAALLLLPGCTLFHAAFGFDRTPNAIYCGRSLGIDVWVDGVNFIHESHPEYSVKAMQCPQALATVVQTRDEGARRGLWPADREWPGYWLEFINARNLTVLDSIGSDHSGGYTLTLSHRIAVCYGFDYSEEKDKPTELHSSGVILMHELIHAELNGDMDHCHWASKYAPAFKGLQHEWVVGFDDKCEQRSCGGSLCAPDFRWPESGP
jgi:hypothetical protein